MHLTNGCQTGRICQEYLGGPRLRLRRNWCVLYCGSRSPSSSRVPPALATAPGTGGRRGKNGGRGRPAPSMLSRGSCSLSQPSPPAVVGQVLGPRAVAPSSLPAGTVVQVVAVPARPVQRVAVGRARSIAQDETARRRHAASYPLPPTLVVRSLDWSHRRRNVDGSLRGRGSATLASVTVA